MEPWWAMNVLAWWEPVALPVGGVLLLVGLGLGLLFRRARVVTVLGILASAFLTPHAPWLAAALPLVLAVSMVLPEGEMGSPWDLLRVALVGTALGIGWWDPAAWEPWIAFELWAWLAAAVVVVTAAALRCDGESAALLLTLALAFAATAWPETRTLVLVGGGAGLVLALVHRAWRLAFVDTLTGLPGRRALDSACQRLGRRYAMAMVDVDHFKRFNDTWGHHAGDQVLRMVAAQLARVGGGGRAFRYGGEEFAVLFPGRTAEDALGPLEDLRLRIASDRFAVRSGERPGGATRKARSRRGQVARGPHRVEVTVSIGLAEHQAGRRPAEVREQADRALYKAKEAGRNRVVAAGRGARLARLRSG
jgi:diguanylate cyclase (GGDEF)-like protein